ncbi:hypothetical protein [Massilia antarctica]|uniref:hypothetical protein n=1 Tax=Massilia antarctica TaxID=2765360 RepID=UPI00226D968F|nr:hypothetical protein [Massilia sp. H27-R4]MCY0915459.1 hypothetical protein [Massilia sp. H27-R4]
MKSSKPMVLGLANLDGYNSANKWIEASADTTKRAGTKARWRARDYAAAQNQYARYRNAADLLADWESGFDDTIASALAYQRELQFDRTTVSRISGAANAASALLSVLHVLPLADQRSTLKTCVGLAANVVAELNALLGNAE